MLPVQPGLKVALLFHVIILAKRFVYKFYTYTNTSKSLEQAFYNTKKMLQVAH